MIDKPMFDIPTFSRTAKIPFMSIPNNSATGPMIKVELFVNNIPVKIVSSTCRVRDQTHLLKKDYIL